MNKSMIIKELKSELMLYDPEVDEVHILNTTARAIYNLYRRGMSVDEIAEAMKKDFLLEEEGDLYQDIHECIEALKKRQIRPENE